MSLGRTGPANCGTSPSQIGCAPVIEDALRYAVSKGCFVAISAGNDFADGNPTEVIAEIASRVPGAVSVAAVDPAKGHASYSSSGSWIELAAPGGEFGGLRQRRGHSPADARSRSGRHVRSARRRSSSPRGSIRWPISSSPARRRRRLTCPASPRCSCSRASPILPPIEAALEQFATDLGATGRDDLFGFGLVQARNTLRGLGLGR